MPPIRAMPGDEKCIEAAGRRWKEGDRQPLDHGVVPEMLRDPRDGAQTTPSYRTPARGAQRGQEPLRAALATANNQPAIQSSVEHKNVRRKTQGASSGLIGPTMSTQSRDGDQPRDAASNTMDGPGGRG